MILTVVAKQTQLSLGARILAAVGAVFLLVPIIRRGK